MSVYGDDYPRTDDPSSMNWRALDALNGSAFQDGGMFVDAICQLLLSDAEIDREVRVELASAIGRGRSGYRSTEYNSDGIPKPRLVAEGFPAAKMRRAVNDRYRWFDAGEAVFEARKNGITGDEAILVAGKKFKLGFEAMRKYAIPFYKEFCSLIERGDGWLNLDSAVTPIFPELIEEMNSDDEDARELALDEISEMLKSHYIFSTADMAVNGLEAPRSLDERDW
ncbi:hypothetical protein KRZ98_03985 [Sphingobium sp. AS12]|uniref:hypothetical protein n=1 Tax=Sphingobium sp. AS12 TaxID=2849495 RepID=UPI001C31D2F9|nr:hypothetical protein [Sphingobium sp. AS12]MBV2147446.1 hypothetical protein [Sphingobium sp. AS12]